MALQIDAAANADALRVEAAKSVDLVCLSALTGEGMEEMLAAVEAILRDDLVSVEVVIPYDKGEVLSKIHRLGMVNLEEYLPNGIRVQAHVPLAMSRQLLPLRIPLAATPGSSSSVLSSSPS
ncbi:hypothetical protein CBR_g60144 [Chara braunii]|uniref:HflX C-terminal domain-containing protein n=1 Tax=Chara braunii TaxID=69332 RepID=A0A388MF56_CHABU|nr:hypothetical protein CBR_g60144 [Chara braunii]|eukprot:GBG93184.1 hypothetical protein CBR_g60144 [Chara braunii]